MISSHAPPATGPAPRGLVAAVLIACGAVLAVAGYALVLRYRAQIQGLHDELARCRHAARHDVLTGLPNRAVLADQLDTGTVAVLALIDLDGFKQINDTHGHLAGDHVLRVVATRLTEAVDGAGTAIRLGGDEFALTWPHPPTDPFAVVQSVLEHLAHPIRLPDGSRQVPTATAGAAVAGPRLHALDLLGAADAALYTARATGRAAHVTTAPLPHPGPGNPRRWSAPPPRPRSGGHDDPPPPGT